MLCAIFHVSLHSALEPTWLTVECPSSMPNAVSSILSLAQILRLYDIGANDALKVTFLRDIIYSE